MKNKKDNRKNGLLKKQNKHFKHFASIKPIEDKALPLFSKRKFLEEPLFSKEEFKKRVVEPFLFPFDDLKDLKKAPQRMDFNDLRQEPMFFKPFKQFNPMIFISPYYKDDKRDLLKQKLEEVLDKHFPKHRCKERGEALVLFAEAIMAIDEAIKIGEEYGKASRLP